VATQPQHTQPQAQQAQPQAQSQQSQSAYLQQGVPTYFVLDSSATILMCSHNGGFVFEDLLQKAQRGLFGECPENKWDSVILAVTDGVKADIAERMKSDGSLRNVMVQVFGEEGYVVQGMRLNCLVYLDSSADSDTVPTPWDVAGRINQTMKGMTGKNRVVLVTGEAQPTPPTTDPSSTPPYVRLATLSSHLAHLPPTTAWRGRQLRACVPGLSLEDAEAAVVAAATPPSQPAPGWTSWTSPPAPPPASADGEGVEGVGRVASGGELGGRADSDLIEDLCSAIALLRAKCGTESHTEAAGLDSLVSRARSRAKTLASTRTKR